MRRIISAISVLALAFSLVASATSADAAVAGYDSAYAGESAFLNLARGQSGTFTVFFANTGSTSWVKGTGSQVDLAACLDDKTTCNQQDATEAPFNSGWLSATRYATHSQTTVAPGAIGTFTYNVAVPAGQAAGTYRFNGALVLSSTGADIRNEGYYQDVTVATAPAGTAATLTSIAPNAGPNTGGQTVTLTGTDFACTPTFPTVSFGTATATVTSCGATSLTATTPAGANGAVNVTVTNAGAAASNAVTYTYRDETAPVFTSLAVNGSAATLTFSEAICQVIGSAFTLNAQTDFAITVNGNPVNPTGETLAECSAATGGNATATSFVVTLANPTVSGDQVALTITAAGAAKIQDVAGNTTTAQTRTATAVGDTTKPSITSATALSTTTVRLAYSERVRCATGGATAAPQFSISSSTGAPATQTATSTTCSAALTGTTTITLTFANPITASGTVTYTAGADPVLDLNGNAAVTPQTATFSAFAADAIAPLANDTRLTTSGGFSSQLDAGDTFRVAFNEAMAITISPTIRVTDADGSVADIVCNAGAATCSLNTASTTLGGVTYDAGTVLTVTITTTPATLGGFAGTVAGVQIPATITDSIGVTDTTGNQPNWPGSPDRVIDVE